VAAETVVPSENGSVTDVQEATAALETAFDHQELRTVAAALEKVDAPRHPSTADLIDALDDAAVTPADARAVLEDDHGE